MKTFIAGVIGLLAVAWCGSLRGEVVSIDFGSDLGTYFQTVSDCGLFAVTSCGSGLDISKAADGRTAQRDQAIGGGAYSLFKMVGDFSVTVDYALLDFPKPDAGSNEAHLSMWGTTPDWCEMDLGRWLCFYGDNFFKDYSISTPAYASDTAGRMRVQRVGSTWTSSFCPAGETSFTTMGTITGCNTEPMCVQLNAVEDRETPLLGAGLRSDTSLDVRYDNLVIQADGFEGSIPSRGRDRPCGRPPAQIRT
ncbi:MAG: hypothetical protein ABSF26_29530 [Thermoguttaceae bacterium]|jgi:hypothetical protein